MPECRVVILPEWICLDMAEVAISLGRKVRFYTVNDVWNSSVPLELSVNSLVRELEVSRFCASQKDTSTFILFAHPLGFIDHNIDRLIHSFLTESKLRGKVFFAIDLAQSYGNSSTIDNAKHEIPIYISFNGNKLLNHGGAIRLIRSNRERRDSPEKYWTDLLVQMEKGIQRQRMSFKNMLYTIKHRHPRISRNIEKSLSISEDWTSRQVNLHRVVILSSFFGRDDLLWLERHGYGQRVHPKPQKNNPPSWALRTWQESTFHLFSEAR